jgi:hypothetical protein
MNTFTKLSLAPLAFIAVLGGGNALEAAQVIDCREITTQDTCAQSTMTMNGKAYLCLWSDLLKKCINRDANVNSSSGAVKKLHPSGG